MVAAGGSTDIPYKLSPEKFGVEVASFTLDNNLDGIDFDLEHFLPGFRLEAKTDKESIDWVSNDVFF